jgi:hypothetical protein
MNRLRLVFSDRKRRQRGSVLSGLLIIVAFLAIVVGSLMTELTSSFLVSRTLVTRVEREATVSSAVELGIHQLQNSATPPVCARDARGPWFATVNGMPAAVTETCGAIVPDLGMSVAPGSFAVDGLHDTGAGRDRYIVGDASGRLYAYAFGATVPAWSVSTGGPLTGTPGIVQDSGSAELLVPSQRSGDGCGGYCVAVFNDNGGTPTFRCGMATSAPVRTQPATEVAVGGSSNFPTYVFFADSEGNLQVYDADEDYACGHTVAANIEGTPAGPPLVFSGTVSNHAHDITTSDDIFVVVTGSSGTVLQHWRYSEVDATDRDGSSTITLSEVGSLGLASSVGGRAVGYAINSRVASPGSSMTLAIAAATGRIALARISVRSGPSYTMSTVASIALPSPIARPPYWCHCPGQDLIGVSGADGFLYLLDTGLNTRWRYDSVADGRPAIITTAVADVNGDWYFGADDGYVYDVEVPASGQQMFKAARFGPGGAIRSSPVVGSAADGCGAGPCLYFGSSAAGAYFAQLGTTRIVDLRACVSSSATSTACVANPRLWARVEVGSPSSVGGSGVYVQGWSYYTQ